MYALFGLRQLDTGSLYLFDALASVAFLGGFRTSLVVGDLVQSALELPVALIKSWPQELILVSEELASL